MSVEDDQLFGELRERIRANERCVAEIVIRIAELENLLLATKLFPERSKLPDGLFPAPPNPTNPGEETQARSFRQHQQE